jgi:hypothetical protein
LEGTLVCFGLEVLKEPQVNFGTGIFFVAAFTFVISFFWSKRWPVFLGAESEKEAGH